MDSDETKNFLSRLSRFAWEASTTDTVKWSSCGKYFQFRAQSQQLPYLLDKYFQCSNIYGFLALLYGNGFIRLPNTDWYYHSHGLFRRIYSPVYLPIPPPDHIPYGLPRLVRPFCLPVNRPKMPAVHVPYGLVASGESNSLEAESKMSPAIKPVSEGKNEAVDRTMAVASNTERLGVTETVKNEDHSSIVDCKQSETVCQKQRTSLTDNLSAAVAENKDFSAIATSCQDKQIKIAKCEENDAVLTATLENDIASASIVGAVVNDDHIVVPVSNQHEQIEIDVATERDDISSAIAEAVEKEDLDITTSKIQNEQIEFAEIVNETVDSIVAAFIEAVEFEDQSANVVRNQDDQIEVSEKAIERIDFTETITSDKESAVITEIVAPRDCDDQVKFAGGENEALMIVETIEDNDHTVIMSNIQDELIELAERENESVDCTLTTESDKQASASIAEAVEQDHAAFAERDNDKQVEFFVRENETVDHSVTSTSDIVSAVITETVVCSDVACNNKELSSENANPLLLTLDNGVEQSDVVPCVEENIKSADRAMADSCACTNNEQSMVPCNNENFILTDLSTSIVDQMVTVDSDSVVKLPATDDILSMDCSSVDEPDIPSCRDELMEKTDIELFSQYKSGEEILASTDDLFSTQYHSGSEETVTNVDIMMAASNCDDASCNECDDRKQDDDPCDDSLLENVHQTPTTSCMNEEQSRLPCDEESIKNTDIFYTQVDGLQQLDAPYDEVFTVKENSCQTATSLCSDTDIARSDVSYDEAAFENMDILYTQVDGVDQLDGKNADQCFINSCINAEPFDVPCNEASTANMASGLTECNSLVLSELVRARMECNENIMDNSELTVTTNTQCDVSCDHGTDDCCTTLDARVPFLKRNRKRKFRTPTFQSPLHLKNSINPELLADICSPNLNVPLIMPSAKTSQRDQYRVHILQKESNGRVLTTTMSFFLKAYQCHFCEFNGCGMESIWQHCSKFHGDQNVFFPIETTDGVFHLLVEQKLPPQSNAQKQTSIGKSQVNESSLLTDAEMPCFKDVFLSGISLPKRQYYHDMTFDPIGLSEWLFILKDIDNDQEWRGVVDTSALSDMSDVSAKEKHFMTLWNNFMRSHPILSEIQLSSQLVSFVQELSNAILEFGLEEELIAHMTNMWVEGHIGQWTMLESMKVYRDILEM